MPTDRPTTETPGGLALVLDRLWGQEVTHKLILAELFRHTELGTSLGLWTGDDLPSVVVEPSRGIFDLALNRGPNTVGFIELKFGAESGQNQRERQRAWAEAANAHRSYILLGTSYFEIPREASVRYIGVPELLTAITATTTVGDVGELARAYVERLGRDARVWVGEHDPATANSVAILRLYQEIADAWPVTVNPWRATNPAGPDWILNGDAWTTVDIAGWQSARFYWEIAGGHLRFKVEWNGERLDRLTARTAYQRALEIAAREVGVDVEPTVQRSGRSMAAAQLPGAVRDCVLVEGRVAPEHARRLYDDATAIFDAALRHLEPLVITRR
ncbi:MAG: hypothetical protein H0W81_06135 [Chloroflexi bacterium]|nr:hypothetical protein [Chloroflexota bacterium]